MPQKRGNLRVLKQGQSIYGPMTRADLETLIAQGRIGVADQVSYNEGPWVPISEFLAARAALSASAPAPPGKPAPAAPADAAFQSAASDRILQVLSGDKIYGPMSRDQVIQLVAASRLKTDDLIRAIDGPWMPMTDFLAPARQGDMPYGTAPYEKAPYNTVPYGKLPSATTPPAATHPATAPLATTPPAIAPLTVVSPAVVPWQTPPAVPSSPAGIPRVLPAAAGAAEEAAIIDLTLADMVESAMPGLAPLYDSATLPEPAPQTLPPANLSLLEALDPIEPMLSSQPEWFVKIRGMPSAHLSTAHLKSLIVAREIHAETPTAHVGWDDTDWRPLRAVRELAGLLKFLPP